MSAHPRAGQAAQDSDLIEPRALEQAYFARRPDPANVSERIAFGTSGHRGSPLVTTFNEAHLLAITQAVCDYRRAQGIDGPLYLGRDTHAISAPAFATALEVLAANAVVTCVDSAGGYTPTPAVSHAILAHNRDRVAGRADGIVITPSHNPPADGGIKYNPPHGGPAETEVTRWIEDRANAVLADGLAAVRRHPQPGSSGYVRPFDFAARYVDDLDTVIDTGLLRGCRLRVAVDPLGGSGIAYWPRINARFGVDIEIVNATVDPRFAFMRLDWDGRIRMDCSSAHAMSGLLELKDRYDLAFANDTDNDRHGIVTRAGLMNPNHYLTVAIDYLFRHRRGWRADAGIGKTIVSTALIDRLAARLDRPLVEVPVGFKWFVGGLHAGTLGFGGEESAGASFLCRDGSAWSTDKDGILLNLLAIEMAVRNGRSPSELYAGLSAELGAPVYARIDTPATRAQKVALARLQPEDVRRSTLAGDPIRAVESRASGTGAPIGGLKVSTDHGWFAARPSGTEDVYKLYAESFRDAAHLRRIQDEANDLLASVLS